MVSGNDLSIRLKVISLDAWFIEGYEMSENSVITGCFIFLEDCFLEHAYLRKQNIPASFSVTEND